MNRILFKSFFLVAIAFGLAGCIFSWKPSISGSSVNVNDTTSPTTEVSRETN